MSNPEEISCPVSDTAYARTSMAEALALSPVHRIIDAYSDALTRLGLHIPPLSIERRAVAVHQSLSSRARDFHTHQHVLDLLEGADPLEALAALYHDIVYVQVDLDVPTHYAGLLRPLLDRDGATHHGWRLLPRTGEDAATRDVLAVFGRSAGQVLTPMTGLNELASGLVAAKELEGILSREQLLAVLACIESSIPFRDDEGAQLSARLAALGLRDDAIVSMATRATRLSNKDVGNFANPDPAEFLDNTWKLLPETNPSLHTPTAYTVCEYRHALMKMEGFLSHLPPERVFHVFQTEPHPDEHQRRIAIATRNIALSVRYLRCKLYASSVIEALALESGGDGPLPYFMGGTPDMAPGPMKRLEQFLPVPTPAVDPHHQYDSVLRQLLQEGRTTNSSFDITPSPVADFLYVSLGEARLMEGCEEARQMWQAALAPKTFLEKQPRAPITAIAQAASHMAPTRAHALDKLVQSLS